MTRASAMAIVAAMFAVGCGGASPTFRSVATTSCAAARTVCTAVDATCGAYEAATE